MLTARDMGTNNTLVSLSLGCEELEAARIFDLQIQQKNAEQQQQDIVSIEGDLAALVGLIAQVQQEAAASSQTIEDLSNSIEKVKTVVGY